METLGGDRETGSLRITSSACFQLDCKRFISRHGGLWLASDAETEQHIADTV